MGARKIKTFYFYFSRIEMKKRWQAAKKDKTPLIVNTVNGKPYTLVTEMKKEVLNGTYLLVSTGELKNLKIIKRWPKT